MKITEQPLSDLKVIEYAHGITGPFCTKLLADLGAEVIKVEDPGIGDTTRRMEPFMGNEPHPERSGLFLYLNTNKLGITLNLKSPAGAKVFRDLIKDADILVENNSPGTMEALGLGYDTLKQINPRLVMASITPFGQTGPYRDYKSCDLIAYHIGGAGYGTPMQVDSLNHPPLKAGGHQAHFCTGLSAAILIMSAIFSRHTNGEGKHIDLSEHEAIAFNSGRDLATYTYMKTVQNRVNSGLTGFGMHLKCKDGSIMMYLINDIQWQRAVETMGNPEWARDDRFKDYISRSQNWETLEPLLEEWTGKLTKSEVAYIMQADHVACSPVNTIEEVMASEHMVSRDFFIDVDHPQTGSIKYPGPPCKLSKNQAQTARPAPALGQHNEEIICHRLGYAMTDLLKMREARVI
ncbi:MAG: CoA transferase [Chloroflexota bacterium]|nr:CoA transferase [Chloroflexota bacterium]